MKENEKCCNVIQFASDLCEQIRLDYTSGSLISIHFTMEKMQ